MKVARPLRRSSMALEDRLARLNHSTPKSAQILINGISGPNGRAGFADEIVLFLIRQFRYLLSAKCRPLEYSVGFLFF